MENKKDLLFWWSIVSTILSVLLLMWDVYQFGENRRTKDIHTSQVKIWQHFANGINNGMMEINDGLDKGKFSSTQDVQIAIKSVLPETYALYKSLNEERLFSEEEIKNQQLETEKYFQDLLKLKNTN